MPDGSCVESSESGTKTTWSPIKNWHSDDVREPAKPAEKETAFSIQLRVVYVVWDGAGGGGGRSGGWEWLLHHAWQLPVNG